MDPIYNGLASYNSVLRTQINEFLKIKLKEAGNDELIPSHGSLLWIVYRHDGMVQIKTIYERLCKQKSTITEMIKRLVHLGYLEKHECSEDKRVTYVVATQKALDFQPHFERISKELLAKLYKGFSEEEKKQYIDFVQRAIHNFM